ncbi:hypothetical protein DI09_11p420, partial [Mitosporidium daphniae]
MNSLLYYAIALLFLVSITFVDTDNVQEEQKVVGLQTGGQQEGTAGQGSNVDKVGDGNVPDLTEEKKEETDADKAKKAEEAKKAKDDEEFKATAAKHNITDKQCWVCKKCDEKEDKNCVDGQKCTNCVYNYTCVNGTTCSTECTGGTGCKDGKFCQKCSEGFFAWIGSLLTSLWDFIVPAWFINNLKAIMIGMAVIIGVTIILFIFTDLLDPVSNFFGGLYNKALGTSTSRGFFGIFSYQLVFSIISLCTLVIFSASYYKASLAALLDSLNPSQKPGDSAASKPAEQPSRANKSQIV